MDISQMIERWGFPAAFAVWLMFVVTRELREIRALINKQVVLNAVILKTIDASEAAIAAASTSLPPGKE